MSYGYDDASRRTSITYPGGAGTVTYAYDNANRRTSITYPGGAGTVTYGYDNANRLTSVTDWNSNAISYGYDDAGRLTSKTLPSGTGVVTSYTYDNADRLTAISHVKGGSTTLASVSYTLDGVGNRTQRVDQQGTHTYAYDNVYRLTSVTYPGPATTTYAFDAFGNRTSKVDAGGTTSYSYDDNDRITTVTPPSPASAISYTWDNNGDLTGRGGDSFSWDVEDRLTSATVNSVTTTFAYRGDGLRDSRTTGGNTTTFTWDLNRGLPVVLDDGNQYVYGGGLEAMRSGSSWYYYLADGLGSTMAVVDASGAVAKSYTYDVYGKPTAAGSLANAYDFAGQATDATGLQYLRARYMDPETGTFLSREPLAVFPDWLGNNTGYASCNPTSLMDPSGLRPTDGSGDDSQGRMAEKCRGLVDAMQAAMDLMNEDRDVVEGRGSGRPVTQDDKKGKIKRFKNTQKSIDKLTDQWDGWNCDKFLPSGSATAQKAKEYAGQKPPSLGGKSLLDKIKDRVDNVPDPPDVWWDGDPINPWVIPWPGRGPIPIY